MRILIAAGGTGGHIYPALALARLLRSKEDAEVLFVGTKRGMENEIVPAAGFPLERIEVEGLERRPSLRMVRSLFLAGKSAMSARRLIKEFRPHAAVGFGGYVTGPVIMAAALFNVPAVIHEQNAVPGFTNLILSRFADYVCSSFPGIESKFPRSARVLVTGNPRATEAVQAKADALPEDFLTGVPVLIFVSGSHGAAKLNEVIPETAASVLAACDVQVAYVTGKNYYEKAMKDLASLFIRFPRRLHVFPFYEGLPGLLSRSSLAVSRAGATTLAELTALGVPSILIPSPNVTGNHQELNARILADQGAAVMINEQQLDGPVLAAKAISLLQSKKTLAKMSQANLSLGFPDAAERMLTVLREITNFSGRV